MLLVAVGRRRHCRGIAAVKRLVEIIEARPARASLEAEFLRILDGRAAL